MGEARDGRLLDGCISYLEVSHEPAAGRGRHRQVLEFWKGAAQVPVAAVLVLVYV
jgi:hypothetical protein